MKNISLILILWFIAVSINFANDDALHFSQRNKEADPEHHKARKEWLESIHRTEPGVDYKVLKREFLKSKLQSNNEKRKEYPNNSPVLLKYMSENGKIAGTWKERGSNNQSGRIHTADVDLVEGLVYAASAGGNVWRGTIDGKGWKCLNNSQQFSINSFKVEHYGDFRRIFVFDRVNLYYSDNEGHTWEPAKGLENIARWGGIFRGLVIRTPEGRKIYVLADEWDFDNWKHIKSVYFSGDDGLNFTKVFSVNNTQLIDIWGMEQSRGEYGYTSTGGEVEKPFYKLICFHRDTLFAISETEKEILNILDEIGGLSPSNIRISGTDVNGKITLYFNPRMPNNGKPVTFVSYDLGNTLYEKSVAPENYFMSNSFCVSKLDPDFAYIGGVDCYFTKDAADNWTKINGWGEYYRDPLNKLHADIPGLKCFRISKDEEMFLISTDGGIYKTRKDYSVENISLADLNVSQYYSIYTYYGNEGSIIYAGSQDQGYQRSEMFSDKILDFEQTISGDYGSLTSGDGGRSIWTIYPGFAMFYPDAINSNVMLSWNFRNLANAKVWMPPIVAVPGNPYLAYIAPGGTETGSSNLWKLNYNESENKIETTELPYRFNANEDVNYVSALGISSINVNYLYALTRKGVFYYSTDAGMNWTETSEFIGPGYNYLHGTAIFTSKNNLGTVYIAGSGYSNPAVFVTKDNGTTFTAIEGLPPAMVYDITLNDDESALFAATSLGPYIYIFNHNKWYHIAGLDAPEQDYWSVNYISQTNTVRFATYGRGIWDFDIEKLVTNVSTDELSVNYEVEVFPNPAQEYVNIKLSNFNSQEHFKINILDLQGRLIATIFEGALLSENQTFTFNFSEIGGIPNGTYLLMVNSQSNQKYFKLNISK